MSSISGVTIIQRAEVKDRDFLEHFCTSLYSYYFADFWEEDGLVQYLEKQFSTEVLQSDLAASSIHYYIIWQGKVPIGFIKINTLASIDDLKDVCELEKMYILPEYNRQGHGKAALLQTLEIMSRLGKKWMFLEVLQSNKSALTFYRQMGFVHYDNKVLRYPLFKADKNKLHRLILDLKD